VESAKARERLNISSEHAPWTRSASLGGFPCCPRNKDVLDIAWAAHTKEMPIHTSTKELAADFWADPSQQLSRRPWSTNGIVRTFTQTSTPYSYQEDVFLSGYDMLRCHGAPLGCALESGKITDAQLRSLAGESFAAPVLTVVLHAYWLNPFAFWWQEPPEDRT